MPSFFQRRKRKDPAPEFELPFRRHRLFRRATDATCEANKQASESRATIKDGLSVVESHSYDQAFPSSELDQLISRIQDYQLTHGNVLKAIPSESVTRCNSTNLGTSALPTAFPRRQFEQARRLQTSMNNLYLSVASNVEWLEAVIAPLLEHDGFIRTLWHIFRQVRDAGGGSHIVAGIFRSDYMLHLPTPSSERTASLKQVEMNTFSCAGACHAETVINMHRHLTKVADAGKPIGKKCLPSLAEATENTDGIVRTLQAAHEAYKTRPTNRQTCILMVVQPWNFNIADERPIEYGLWAGDVPCYRCEWPDVLSSTRLLDNGMLLYTPTTTSEVEIEVSVVYYRAGYDEAEYLTDVGRQSRLRLEMSKAIKCPDVLGHLAGIKRVQQALAEPDNVKKFLSQEQTKDVQAVFMSMQNLDSFTSELEAGGKALDKNTVTDQVLKPNLEGGGHNYYGTEILDHLHRMPRREWCNFTIMQRIEPPPNLEGVLLLDEGVYQGPVVSELGVLGGVVWRCGARGKLEVLRNEMAGASFKTKPKGVNQLNVVRGYGCFDCPRLD
ncbi:hypothetical protein D0866_02048 [Hortaea werneckii]|uniref:Glutathione synthetase n=1 Tax=Hortaea werneckii TaxID=91943 RepID=A0A3M7BHJ9_HORWE|nr:hypothetical protein D0866_02048 [Hortaea werneckii]